MFWTRGLSKEILGDDETFRLLCSLVAATLAREGRETCRIAALVPEGLRDLAPGVARHGAEQERHARLLGALLAARGLEPAEIPPEADHARLLERRGGCPVHVRVRRGEPISERDVVAHLAHGYVTAVRTTAWLDLAADRLADRPEVADAAAEIASAERDRLAHCREELLRFARAGHGAAVRLALRENASAEVGVHRDVVLAVLARVGRLSGWRVTRSVALEARVQAGYAYERLVGRRRTVDLLPPPPPERTDRSRRPRAPEALTPSGNPPDAPPEEAAGPAGAATASRGA
ncbi:ferritin-like domain-containing protein [Streptomyces sp. TRM43335]|uniref:Ferritin-like domain-containing protein n=1 Tax=Streptomyces taklimakanensis TaxID=2569853 RepID=A0A6G2B7T4_9ACTN|nr:ferritin-like domain-containing protein [Streptomyces taklimakanensis]MTE18327.1 ferritin-like domain-containing protein [Streptomyces taklimakanensis]